MKSLLIFICLPLLLYCQPRDYFFVPTMRTYNRMLCQSGVPGTENPLICPQNSSPLQFAPELYDNLLPHNLYSSSGNEMMSGPPPPPSMVRQLRKAPSDQPYLVPIAPFSSEKREEPLFLQEKKPRRKIYLIPWESEGEKPLVNFILVPDDLLAPNAPLDTLDDERRLELKVTRSRRPKVRNHVHSNHKRRPKSSKYSRHQERSVKEFHSVHSGHDSDDDDEEYDDSAND